MFLTTNQNSMQQAKQQGWSTPTLLHGLSVCNTICHTMTILLITRICILYFNKSCTYTVHNLL